MDIVMVVMVAAMDTLMTIMARTMMRGRVITMGMLTVERRKPKTNQQAVTR